MPTINSINSNIPIEISKGGTNAITMATATGLVKYDGIGLVTSATALLDASNRLINTAQPAFSAYISASATNVTGDGTNYTIAFNGTFFNQGNYFDTGTYKFTAPVTGKYIFNANVLLQQLTAAMTPEFRIVTTNRTFLFGNYGGAWVGNFPIGLSVFCDMNATDTAYAQVLVSGGTKVVDTYGTAADARTTFSGALIC